MPGEFLWARCGLVLSRAPCHPRGMSLGHDELSRRRTALDALGIEQCFSQVRANHFGALVPWLVAVVLLAPVASPLFWGWAVLMPVYVLASFALHLAYLRHRPAGSALRRWGRYLVFHNVFMGLLTGIFPLFLGDGLREAMIYLVLLVVVGPWFGAAVITAPMPSVFPAWIVSQPLVLLSFLHEQRQPWEIAALIAMALLASFLLWYHAARLNRRSAALRFDNLDLAEKARGAAQVKARFLSAVGHDLRQPLNALRLFHGALGAELSDPSQRRLLRRAEAACTELQHMLDSLSEQTRLEGGRLRPVSQVFVLGPWLHALVEEVRPLAEGLGLTLRLHVRDEVVESDPHLLARLVRNLLVNAVRHSRQGGVLLGVRRRGGRLRITVWDTGPGIPPGQQQRIFAEFVRLSEEGEGLGLGLSIVRQLAEVLGHPLGLRSRPGRGSAFSVDVPRVEPAPGWVLVVDDDAGGREAVLEVLRREGLEVVAVSGPFDPPRRWPAPALVVCDYHLGQTRGTALIAGLRGRYGVLPALLVSGDPRTAGVSSLPWLPKPVDPEALRHRVRALIGQ